MNLKSNVIPLKVERVAECFGCGDPINSGQPQYHLGDRSFCLKCVKMEFPKEEKAESNHDR